MGDDDVDGSKQVQREKTDESLRIEREKTDADVAEKREAVDERADELVRLARQRADELVQAARDEADGARRSIASAAVAERERGRADTILEHERSDEDAALEQERSSRRRYLADFLAAEREATDHDLVGERAHADTLIAARDEFLATVSHDLRTLLGGLALSARLVVEHAPTGAVGDPLRGHAARSQRLVARMNRLVNDLLDVASIEAGKLALFPEQVDVGRVLRDTVEAFEPIAAPKRITLVAVDLAPPVIAWLDDGRILQVLANLVGNAIKFTPAGGQVTVEVRGAGDDVVEFAVRDTGIGIPAASLGEVFERFRQVRKDPRGLGLGLHISKSIVEAHGGRMWAESEVGVGSAFYFTVPQGAGPGAPPR
jgi:signal transduction histidine kinase